MLARRGAGLQQVMRRQAGARQQLTIAQASSPQYSAGRSGWRAAVASSKSGKPVSVKKSGQESPCKIIGQAYPGLAAATWPAGYDRQLLILAITPCGDCLFLE